MNNAVLRCKHEIPQCTKHFFGKRIANKNTTFLKR